MANLIDIGIFIRWEIFEKPKQNYKGVNIIIISGCTLIELKRNYSSLLASTIGEIYFIINLKYKKNNFNIKNLFIYILG